MKRLLATFVLLLLMGCASKPHLPSRADIECQDAGVCVKFLPDGAVSIRSSISHVTREQWQAAQGLYNRREPGICGNTYNGVLTDAPCSDTFPPSGDAK